MRRWPHRLLAAVGSAAAALGLALVPSTAAHAATCTTYYVSSSAGSDSNDGCSSSTPWKTLTNVNSTTFSAGDQILFQDGGSWTGELAPQGSGTSGNQIVVSDYGSGSAPVINGGGAAAAVYLDNQEYWTIQNLEITNTAASAALRSGIQLQNDTSGILHGIHLVNNNIHNVLGYWSKSGSQPSNSSGIAANLSDSYSTNGWDDLLIEDNTLTSDDAGGIYIGSLNGTGHSISTTNVVIQNNTMTDLGGNDVVCVYCDNPQVQYNVTTNSGYRYSGAGYWMALNNNGVWQHNEISRQWRALWDGQAFDIDHDNNGVVLQYNYTHDNPFGFQEYCCSKSFGAKNSVVRYNISQNDGTMNAVLPTLQGIANSGTSQVYNNTFYMGPGDNGAVTNGTAAGNNVTFSNNIVYNAGSGGGYSSSGTWTHNLFYGTHDSSEPTDANKVTADPQFVAPGGGTAGLSGAAAYELQPGSPAIGAGVLVSSNGGQDYFGNSVSSTAAPSIGAYNGSGVTPTATTGAYWPLDEGTGTSTADATNDANTGTLQAGASWTTGKVGAHAVSLTGASNSWVDVPTTALDTSGSYSVSAWVKLNSLTGSQTFASIDGSSISPFYLQLSGGTFAFTVRSADSTSASYTKVTGGTPATGTWYHVAGVYDNSAHTIALYLNGVLQSSKSFSSPWKATGHTTIGRAKWNGGNVDFVNGAIDDVRMTGRAITAQEALALGTGANAYYELDDGSGTTATNFMTSAPSGGLIGNASWAGSGKVGGNSVSLTGSGQSQVTIPGAALDTSGSYSVSAWVKLNSVSGNQTFVSQSGANISPYYLQLTGGKFAMTERNSDSTSSTATSVTATSSATTGTWYHLVGVYDASASTISLYVNGTLQGSTAYSSAWKANGTTQIGDAWWNGNQVDWVNGQIDDVHFYNRVLSTSEVQALAAG